MKKKKDLQSEIQMAIEENTAIIAARKLQVFDENETHTSLIGLKKKKEEQLKERIASYHLFKSRSRSISSLHTKVTRNSKLLESCAKRWFEITRCHTKFRKAMTSIGKVRGQVVLSFAMRKWKSMFDHTDVSAVKQTLAITSKGSRRLFEVQVEREQAYDEVKSSMVNLLSKTDVVDGSEFDLRRFPREIAVELIRGDNYNSLENYDKAIEIYQAALQGVTNNTSITSNHIDHIYCFIQERLARCFIASCQWSNAIVNLEYLFTRAQSSKGRSTIQIATFLLGKCYYEVGDFDLATENFLNIIKGAEVSCTQRLHPEAYLGLSRCYDRMNDVSRSTYYRNLYHNATCTLQDNMKALSEKANKLEHMIIDISFKEMKVTHFQRVSSNFVAVKTRIKELQMDLQTQESKRLECQKDVQSLHQLVTKIKDEIKIVISRDNDMQTSSLIHDNFQQIEKEELLKRLNHRKENSGVALQGKRKLEEDLLLRQKNCREEILSLETDLKLEQSSLIQKVLRKRSIRCAIFNKMNQNGVDAFGRKSGGRQMIAFTIDSDVYVHDMQTGIIKYGFAAKEKVGNPHTRKDQRFVITCAQYYMDKIYFGTTDRKIYCWNMISDRIVFIAVGHKGTITCVVADNSIMISGSTDKSLILWDSNSGKMLFRAVGHSRGISSVFGCSAYLASGDLDGEIIFWETKTLEKPPERKYVFQTSRNKKISVVRCSKYEVVCGDEGGYVLSWRVDRGALLNERKVHEKSVRDLQFDATIMVTCSMDTTIKVLDITSFEILQSIRGHGNPVLAVCFDNTMILSLSNNGTMKQWQRDTKTMDGNNADVIHTFNEGESLKSICEDYGVTMKDLMKWNVNRDIKKITVGQKLIVVKGTLPDKNRNYLISTSSVPVPYGHQYFDDIKKDLTSLASRLNR